MRRIAVALAAVLGSLVWLVGAASNEAGAAAARCAHCPERTSGRRYVSRLAGNTPLQVGSLTPGDHRVRVVKDGYLENARVVSVGTTPKNVLVKLTAHWNQQRVGRAGQRRRRWPRINKWLWIGIAGGRRGGGCATGGNKRLGRDRGP
jgi:hypothetical protein